MEPNAPIWPSTVPETLRSIRIAPASERSPFPFSGFEVSTSFAVAFFAGTLLIAAFAWRKFAVPTYDVNAEAYREFPGVSIWTLKDSASLRRAYVIYCICIIAIYFAIAFFGRIIFDLATQLNVAGLNIPKNTFQFDSWQWPILLALGIAGFSKLLEPIIPLESVLRRFAHEVVGIPTRLQAKRMRLEGLLMQDAGSDAKKKLDERLKKLLTDESLRTLWKDILQHRLAGAVGLYENLTEIVAWSTQEHKDWSEPSIRQKLNDTEQKSREEATKALSAFEALASEGADAASVQQLVSDEKKRKRYEKYLFDAVDEMERAQAKFALIMAIYCENSVDRNERHKLFDSILDEDLRKTLTDKVINAPEAPPLGLPLYTFAVIFGIYWLAISHYYHRMVFDVPFGSSTVLLSAVLETLKVFLIVWFPLTAVAVLQGLARDRQVTEEQASAAKSRWRPLIHAIPGAIFANVLAGATLCLYALLVAALPSATIEQARGQLFTGPKLIFDYLPLALVTPIIYLFVTFVRRSTPPLSIRARAVLGVTCAIVVICFMSYLIRLDLVNDGEVDYCRFGSKPYGPLGIIFYSNVDGLMGVCLSYYNLLNVLIVGLCAFVSVIGIAVPDGAPDNAVGGAPGGAAGSAPAIPQESNS